MENIIQHQTGTIIMNGGNPLEGCPKDWGDANLIEEQLNEHKDEDEPHWKFDCGFKLDYDGDIVRVCSRFYPPKTHYGPTWDGSVSVYFANKKLKVKEFNCPTLQDLQKEVETYVQSIINCLETSLINFD